MNLYSQYQVQCSNIEEESSLLLEKIKEIYDKGDMTLHARRKKISAYRVYKRETAAYYKSEYPNMKNSERQMIVKSMWQKLEDDEKLFYVVKARIEEEECFH